MSLLVLALLAACGGDPFEEECDSLCRELVQDCAFEAYPSLESCVQGCTWSGEQGADIEEQLECVEDAECDTFLVIECEHEHGEGG